VKRDFLRLFAPLAVLVIAVAVVLTVNGIQAETQRHLASQAHFADVATTSVAQSLAPVIRHLRSLAHEAPICAALQSHTSQGLDGTAGAFAPLLLRNPS